MKKFNRHCTQYFKAISQAFFFDQAFFGVMLLLVLSIFSRPLLIAGVSASLVGYAFSELHSTPRVLKDTGLITINGFFYGLAVATLFQPSVQFFTILCLGAFAVPYVTKAMHEVLQHWKLSPLIVPYILTVWVMWLCAPAIHLERLPFPTVGWPAFDSWVDPFPVFSNAHLIWKPEFFLLRSVGQSMGRLLFLPHPLFGFSILLLVTAFSPRRGVYFLFGTVMATLAAYAVTGGLTDTASTPYSFYTYSAGLIGLGMASFPEKFSLKTIAFFCALSSVLTLAVHQFLSIQQLPSLSLPYVLTLWLAVLSRVPKLNISWAPRSPSSQVLQSTFTESRGTPSLQESREAQEFEVAAASRMAQTSQVSEKAA